MIISFIGGGNMAVAMLSGMLQQEFQCHNIHVIERDGEKRRSIAAQYGVHVADSLERLPPSDIIILAVKPQQVKAVLTALPAQLQNSLLMSIAAGVNIKILQLLCGASQRIIRVMPNTPALIGAGISGAIASLNVNEADKELANTILQAIGEVVWVKEEAALDAITAISGSGPAYVFYFMEALQAAAQNQGFDDDTARQLAYATFSGAVKLAQASHEPVKTLRAKVTSEKGTTAEGISVLTQHHVSEAVDKAVKAAAKRAYVLGEELILSLSDERQ